MNQLNKKYLILGGTLMGILVILFVFLPSSKNERKKEKEKKEKSPKKEAKAIVKKPINPTGTFLLYQLLRTYDNTESLQRIQTSYKTSLSTVLPKTQKNGIPNVYFAITEKWNLNYSDFDYLKEFIEEGNYAFIAAEDFMYEIKSEFSYFTSDLIKTYYDTAITANFYHPELKQQKNLFFKNAELNIHGHPKFKNWSYLSKSSIKYDAIQLVYNSNEEYPIAAMISIGEGKLIIHTAPDLFANTNMVEKDGKKHAELLFSHLPKASIYWHNDYGKYSPYRGYTQPQYEDYTEDPEYPKSSPLQYIINQPILLTAFILLVIGVVLYMLIQSKRRQRIIPPIESNKNTSLEFVDTVSKLYYQQHRHDKLIAHLEQLFIAYIRHHYYLSSPKVTKEFITRISEKSGISEGKIASIFKGLQRGKNNKASTEANLLDIYTKLNYFYKHCN